MALYWFPSIFIFDVWKFCCQKSKALTWASNFFLLWLTGWNSVNPSALCHWCSSLKKFNHGSHNILGVGQLNVACNGFVDVIFLPSFSWPSSGNCCSSIRCSIDGMYGPWIVFINYPKQSLQLKHLWRTGSGSFFFFGHPWKHHLINNFCNSVLISVHRL